MAAVAHKEILKRIFNMSHSSSSVPIQPDVIVTTIRELQQEKSRHEKTLDELRKTRTHLERQNDSAARDHHMAKGKHDKLMETLKIAQHKLEQSQKELECQQSRNKDLEGKIGTLSGEIDQEKDRQQREVEDFQSKLAEIADKFIQARKYYMDENLANEVTLMEKTKNGLDHKALTMETESDNLAEQLKMIQLEKDGELKKAEHDGISLVLQHQILNIFLTEKSAADAYKTSVFAKEKELHRQLQIQQADTEKLKVQLSQLEKES